MLPERAISDRRKAYAICMANYAFRARAFESRGDCRRAEDMRDKQYTLWFALDVLRAYELTSDTCGSYWCATEADVLCAMRAADCLCIKCGCAQRDPCEIRPHYLAHRAVDAAFMTEAEPGQTYYVISNIGDFDTLWGNNVGSLFTDGVQVDPNPGSIIFAYIPGEFYYATTGGPGDYFPSLTATVEDGTSLQVVSISPNTHAERAARIIIDANTSADDDSLWYNVYDGSEDVLDPNEIFTLSGAQVDPVRLRWSYVINGCTYGPYSDDIEVSPPAAPASFAIIQGGSITNAPGDTIPFNFSGEAEWSLFFWLRSDIADQVLNNAPLVLYSDEVDQSALAMGSANGSDYLIALGQSGGNSASYESATAGTTIADGAWHNIAFVRSSLDINTAPLMYVDGGLVPLSVASAVGAFFADPRPNNIFIGDGSGFLPVGFHIAEVCAYSTARSQSDIQNIIMTNTMDGNDGSWGRLFRYRPGMTESLTVTPFVSGNAAGAPAVSTAGGATIDPANVPSF